MMTTTIVIRPSRRFPLPRFKELWEFRELFYFLVWRDIIIRYRQTILGVGWAIVKPILSVVVITFIFNKLAGFTSEGIPYQLFTLAGILAWNFFSQGVTAASQSMIYNSNLVTKVYFPRLIIPSAAVLRGLVDLGIALLLYASLMYYYSFSPGWQLFLFPLAVAWGVMSCLGVSLWVSAIGVKYHDVAQALPFFVQLLFWISPVGYSSAKVTGRFVLFYWMNPMAGVIECFRYSLLGKAYLPANLLILSLAVSVMILVSGIINFKRMEKEFADVI